MNIEKMVDSAHDNAIRREVYTCFNCDGRGKTRNNTTTKDGKYKFGFLKCADCGGSGQSPTTNIIQKLKEETLELQEAFIEHKTSDIDEFLNCLPFVCYDKTYIELFEKHIKNSQGDELADIVIVCLAASKELGIDLGKHIEAKLYYNGVR